MKRMWLLRVILIALSLDFTSVMVSEMLPVVAQASMATTGAELLKLAEEELKNNQREAAIKLLDRALGIFEAKSDLQGKAKTLKLLGDAYTFLGKNREAEGYYQQAIQLAIKVDDKLTQGKSLNNLGNVYKNLAKYEQAIDYYRQSLLIVRGINDKRTEAIALSSLGNVYGRLGQYQKAESYSLQALQIAREIKNRQGEGNALGSLATVYQQLGQYQKAEGFVLQSLQIMREIKDRLGEGNSLGNLGILYRQLSQYQKAEGYSLQHLQIAREIKDRRGEANALGSLATVYGKLGQYQKAEGFVLQSLQIMREIKDRQGEASSLGNLGIVYQQLGQYQKAEGYLLQHLQIAREIKDRQGQANSLGSLGTVYGKLGQYQKAEGYFLQTLQIAREIKDRRGEASSLGSLGTTYYFLNQLPKTIKYLQQATELSDSLRIDLTDENKISLFETQLQTYKRLATALYLTGDRAGSLIATERGRTRAFNDLLAKRLADTPNLTPPITFTFPQLQAQAISRKSTIVSYNVLNPAKILIHVLKPDGSLTIREIPTPQTPKLTDLITNSRTAIRQSGEYALRQQSNGTTTLSQRGSQLDPNTLKPGMKVRLKSDSATTPGRVVIATNITTGIMTLEAQSDGKPTREEVSFSLVREILPTTFTAETSSLQQLHQILIEPIADLLPSNPQSPVIFIPDGVLYELPFAALQDRQGRYLIEKHTISLAPSLSVLVQTGQLQQRRLSPLSQSLVIGNPTLSKEHEPLPYSQTEAQQVAKQLQSPVLLGSAATKSQVTRQLSTAPIIHLATHGGYNSNGGLNSSGVFLTGSGQQDGFLTASEVLNYKLQAGLVVVSSCDSGRGQISGDGVLGLSRSFIAAGTSSTMVSLWSINDRATADLMTAFYGYWRGGKSKAAALRQAMLDLKGNGKYTAPYFWAAMSLVGEP